MDVKYLLFSSYSSFLPILYIVLNIQTCLFLWYEVGITLTKRLKAYIWDDFGLFRLTSNPQNHWAGGSKQPSAFVLQT